jgi:hypothetical protein
MPAAVHAATTSAPPLHSKEPGTKLSAMTVDAMFCAVTHSGVSRTDVTGVSVCGSVKLQLTRVGGGVSPTRRYKASGAAAWVSIQTGL